MRLQTSCCKGYQNPTPCWTRQIQARPNQPRVRCSVFIPPPASRGHISICRVIFLQNCEICNAVLAISVSLQQTKTTFYLCSGHSLAFISWFLWHLEHHVCILPVKCCSTLLANISNWYFPVLFSTQLSWTSTGTCSNSGHHKARCKHNDLTQLYSMEGAVVARFSVKHVMLATTGASAHTCMHLYIN